MFGIGTKFFSVLHLVLNMDPTVLWMYEGQEFLKEVGGLPKWWDGGVTFDSGRRGGSAVRVDVVDIFLVALRELSGPERKG